jgi:hypothetical protein
MRREADYLQVFLFLRKKEEPGREESKNFGRQTETNGNNFADKRDKGFLFSPSSIASLHASGLNCERKKVYFL